MGISQPPTFAAAGLCCAAVPYPSGQHIRQVDISTEHATEYEEQGMVTRTFASRAERELTIAVVLGLRGQVDSFVKRSVHDLFCLLTPEQQGRDVL